MKINKNSKIFIAGHNGMVGSSIKRKFEENGFKNIITVNKNKLNLIDQKKVTVHSADTNTSTVCYGPRHSQGLTLSLV